MPPTHLPFKNWSRHPPCIASLSRHGAPSDLEESDVNDLLAAYVVAKGLSDTEGEKLVQKIAQRSVPINATSITTMQMTTKAQLLQQFGDCLATARSNDEAYHWDCTRLWTSDEIRKRGACSGWTCPLYLSTASSAKRLLPFTVADVQVERDVLTYVLNVPDGMNETERLDVPPEGFIAEHTFEDGTTLLLHRILWHLCRHIAAHDKEVRVSTLLDLLSKVEVDEGVISEKLAEISRYLDEVKSETPCRPDTFSAHLKQMRERWIRLRGKKLIYNACIALQSLNLPLDVTLETLKTQAQELQHATDDGLPTFEDDLTALLKDIFTKRRRAIPTPSRWLNRALCGGWQAGKVYVVCGPPLACTTDFCAWCADYAAYRRFPVLYVSYGMSREELSLRALSRHSGIDAEQIVMQVADTVDADAGEGAPLQEHLLETVDRLGKRIAHYLTVLEGDAETTITVMRDIIDALRHRVGRDVNDPVLVVVDSVQMMPAEGVQQCCTCDDVTGMQRIFTLLKQFAREAKVVVLALFALTESSYKECIQTQTDTITVKEVSTSLEGAHAVDSVLLLQVGEVKSGEGSSEEAIDQFHRSWDQYKRWFSRRHDHAVIDESFSNALTTYPLDRYTSSYARISLLKNRDGILADPVIIYERPYHRFIPVDIDLTALEGDDK